MSYCSQCGSEVAENGKFCSKCGAPVAFVEPEKPADSQPVGMNAEIAVVPAVAAVPVASVKDKVLGFVGMGLSIFGLIMAVLGLLYTWIGMVQTGLGFGFSLVFSFFSMPLGFVGRSLCNRSTQNGNTSGACAAGRKMAIAAIIVSCVMLFFGLINLID